MTKNMDLTKWCDDDDGGGSNGSDNDAHLV